MFALPRAVGLESGVKAADLFHTRHADWHPAAQRRWERLAALER